MCGWVVVAYRILLSAPGPFGFNWVLELIGTWLGLGDFGTKGLGPELDNWQSQVHEVPEPPASDDRDEDSEYMEAEPEADPGYEAQFDDGFDLGEDYVGAGDNYPGYGYQCHHE